MKKLTTVTLLGLGYLALGLSLSAMPVSFDFNSSQNQDTTSVSGEAWQEEFMKEAATLSDSLGATSVKSMVLKFGIGNDASKKRVSSKKPSRTSFDYFEFHVGANSFRDASGYETNSESLLNGWESLTSRFTWGVKKKIGGPSSLLVIQSGLGIETNQYSFKGDNEIIKSSDLSGGSTTQIIPVTGVYSLRRNSLNQVYMEVPVMAQLDFSQRGAVDKSLSLGFGAYAGMRLGSESTVLGSDWEGERLMTRVSSNFNTHLFRYGLQAQLGMRAWKVTGRLDGRTFFQAGSFQEEVYTGSVTLGYAFKKQLPSEFNRRRLVR